MPETDLNPPARPQSSMGVGDGVVEMTEPQRKALRRSAVVKDYNPERAAKYYARRPAQQLARVAQIASSLGGFIVDVIGDNQTGRFESNAKLRATQLREKLTKLGPRSSRWDRRSPRARTSSRRSISMSSPPFRTRFPPSATPTRSRRWRRSSASRWRTSSP